VAEGVTRIMDMQEATLETLKGGIKLLRNTVVGAHEANIPTAFVLLPVSEANEEEPNDKPEDNSLRKRMFNKFCDMYKRVGETCEKIASTIEDPAGALVEFLHESKFEMHLLCEICMKPQPGPKKEDGEDNDDDEEPVWPMQIMQPRDTVAKFVPMVKIGLKATKAIGIGLQIASFFGGPDVDMEWQEDVDEVVGDLDHDSSVDEYQNVQSQLEKMNDGADNAVQKSQEGFCLRQFRLLLESNDPKKDYANLQRVFLGKGDEVALWCCQNCVERVKTNPNASASEIRGFED